MKRDTYIYQMSVLMSVDKTEIYLTFKNMRRILKNEKTMVTTDLLKELKLISVDDLNVNSSKTEII